MKKKKNERIRVLVTGCAGRMGQAVVKTVMAQADMELAGAVDSHEFAGRDVGVLAGAGESGILVDSDINSALQKFSPHVMVDFTRGWVSPGYILPCLDEKCACVVGTTGISEDDMERIREKQKKTGVPVFIAPNFSIGAVLMMKFSVEASKYFEWAEIIEMHHENKADAPSGTALRTAQLMGAVNSSFKSPVNEEEKISGVRGGVGSGVRIHSVRMPGFLAHQEVILGGEGETLKIRHDSISRECFMPGVMMAVRKMSSLKGMITGLENIL